MKLQHVRLKLREFSQVASGGMMLIRDKEARKET